MDILRINDPEGQHPSSYYAASAPIPPQTEPAEGTLKCDVCVVGGGFTGLSAALHLARAGLDVVLIEANRLGAGASGRNGGQVGTGQRIEQPELEKLVGIDDARKLWDIGLEAVGLTRSLAAESGIDARFRPGILHADHKAKYADGTREHVVHMHEVYGYGRMRYVSPEEMRHLVGSPCYHAGALDLGGGHLHPLRYVLGLAALATKAGVRIHEGSRMTKLEGTTVVTDRARIEADHVVLGLNGYHNNFRARITRRVMPINNFIAATAPLPNPLAVIRHNYAVADSKFVVNYFRLSVDNRLLFGGGESYGYKFPKDIAAKVRRPLSEIFPQLAEVKIDYAWGGTLGITRSRLPHFAQIAPGVLSASGFSGHGVAMATMAGKMLAEAIGGQRTRFDLMSGLPTPRFPGGAALRTPLLIAAMSWYALRDRL